MPRRSLPRATALLVAAALAAACGEEMPQSPADGPAASHEVAAPSFTITEEARDSAFAQAESASDAGADDGAGLDAALQAAGGVQIFEGDRAVVTVASASTARGEQVAVRGVIDALLFPCVGGCGTSESDNVGASTTIGPAPEDGTLQFILPLAAGGTGESQVQGSYPSYTVRMDDGLFDSDFDDVVLSVEIQPAEDECDFFDENVSDPLLQDDDVQVAMDELWRQSNPDAADVRDQVEMGGYIVERNGELEVVPFGSNQNPQMCSSTIDRSEIPDDAELRGFVHTHPHSPGTPVPTDGSCRGITQPGLTFGNGPGREDKNAAAISNVPMFIVDEDEVHRLPAQFSPGDPVPAPKRNPDADCQSGEDR